jgi:regulatory protein YycH of two-component signal transduction system YycFG
VTEPSIPQTKNYVLATGGWVNRDPLDECIAFNEGRDTTYKAPS